LLTPISLVSFLCWKGKTGVRVYLHDSENDK